MQVDNQVANELLIAARVGKRIPEFMDAVSGVKDYRLSDHKRQGCIRSAFGKELIADQFLLHIDEIISTFWLGVFEHLDKAKLHGEVVQVACPGGEHDQRSTDKNPMHYLRSHGKWAVRNYITSLYRKNLQQGCADCGYRSSVKDDKVCPKCQHQMSTVYKYMLVDEDTTTFMPGTDPEAEDGTLEDRDIREKIEVLVKRFGEEVLRGETETGTRAYQILKILTEPSASVAMCGACTKCDAECFDMNTCTNYSANIGQYLGVNKTMIASKVRRIRYAFVNWLKKQDLDEADMLSELVPLRFKA